MFDDLFGNLRSRPTFTDKEKRALHAAQNGKCNGCGLKLPVRNLTVDHIRPFSKGGTERLTNLQLLCGSCNSMKGDGTQAELRRRLAQKGITKRATAPAKKTKAKPKRKTRQRNDIWDWGF